MSTHRSRGSGNIWLDTSGSLTELVGVVAPVVTTGNNRSREPYIRYAALIRDIEDWSFAAHRPDRDGALFRPFLGT